MLSFINRWWETGPSRVNNPIRGSGRSLEASRNPLGRWEIAAGERQTDTSCRERERVWYSGLWKGKVNWIIIKNAAGPQVVVAGHVEAESRP